MSSVRSAILGFLLAVPGSLQGQQSLALGGSWSHVTSRDDNASRSIYAGALTGVAIGWARASTGARLAIGIEAAGGGLTSTHRGRQELTLGGVSARYERRIHDRVFAGAEVAADARMLRHRYAIGFEESVLTSVLALRPVATLALPWKDTEVRVAATAVALMQRPYSRTKTGTFGDVALVAPHRWRDADVALERTLWRSGGHAWRVGYAVRAQSYAAENGFAALINRVYATSVLRLGKSP